jgi:methyltransferase family protein
MELQTGQPVTRDWRAPFEGTYAAAASPVVERIWRAVLGAEYPEGEDPCSFMTRSELGRVAEEVRVGPGDRLLDLGCGRAGAGLWVAASTRADLIGVDIAEAALVDARRRAAAMALPATFRRGEFEATGLDAAAVAAILAVRWRPTSSDFGLRDRIDRLGTSRFPGRSRSDTAATRGGHEEDAGSGDATAPAPERGYAARLRLDESPDVHGVKGGRRIDAECAWGACLATAWARGRSSHARRPRSAARSPLASFTTCELGESRRSRDHAEATEPWIRDPDGP